MERLIIDEMKKDSYVPKRSGKLWLALAVLLVNGIWCIYHYQFDALPRPLGIQEAGERGFSEEEAMKHVEYLSGLGPHYVGSDTLDVALEYVLAAAKKIKETAHWEVNVEVEFFHAEPSANRLVSGLFKGKTLAYSDLKHVVIRISPKFASRAEENAILVSSHIDTVFPTGGAGDCSSCVGVILELARGVSHWAHGFKNSVIFLLNTGEEDGLNGAHSFITQHPWRSTIRLAVDLEAMGVGGKSIIFQGGSDSWAIDNFAKVAKYPSAQIIAQDLFHSGAIKSATDFQVYKEVAGLSGLDFAYMDATAVYHTKNDKMALLKHGSLQHLGENMLAFLLQTGASPDLPKRKAIENSEDSAIFFDILGMYMVVYRRRLATMLHNSVIFQTLAILATSVFIGGYPAAASLGLSCLSIVLMWIFSCSFSVLVAVVIPLICSSPFPYIASPLLVIGLFVAPSVVGALIGQHVGYLILLKHLQRVSSEKPCDIIKLEAERWLFKAGFVQWLAVLILGNYYNIGSSYIALAWLVAPAFAYGLIEATLSPVRPPRPLKIVTLLLGMTVPVIISAGMFIRFAGLIVGILVRFDGNPGRNPEWLGSVILSIYVAVIVCLTLVYLLSYVHLSGAKKSIMLAAFAIFALTISAVLTGFVPPFTEDTARLVNVVHVVETKGSYSESPTPSSYIYLFSPTSGKLTKEIAHIGEGFICGKKKVQDFITFTVDYGCWSSDATDSGWSKGDIPTLFVESDTKGDRRVTQIVMDTRGSTRWSLAINMREIKDFTLEGTMELIPEDNKTEVNEWHTIQFSGGKNAPKKFNLKLFWVQKSTELTSKPDVQDKDPNILLKLRTDVNWLTPKVEKVLEKLPPWCAVFGKSTSPHALAFLTSLPIDL